MQDCGGAACLATALFLVPYKARTGVLVSLSHPLLTQASTQRASRASEPSGLVVGFAFFLGCRPCRRLPQASRGLRGPPQPPGAFGARMLGLVVGFASFLGCQPCSFHTHPEISAFPGCLGRPAHWPPERRPEDPQGQGC